MANIVTEKANWYWLSFRKEDRNLGVIIIDADTLDEAIMTVTDMRLNPGGQVNAWTVDITTLPKRYIRVFVHPLELYLIRAKMDGPHNWKEEKKKGVSA